MGVFCARFIAGLRVLNGLIAGSLLMSWPRFFLFDILGAACWVALVCSIGYFFGDRLSWLIHFMGRTGLILLASAVIVIALWVLVQRYERGRLDVTPDQSACSAAAKHKVSRHHATPSRRIERSTEPHRKC
jgi:membrane protein DedA with SNARE-associated domain